MYIQELLHTTIEHYTIERHLARGGMANVFLARDLQQPEGVVAIKAVLQRVGEHNERFLREAQVMVTTPSPYLTGAAGSTGACLGTGF